MVGGDELTLCMSVMRNSFNPTMLAIVAAGSELFLCLVDGSPNLRDLLRENDQIAKTYLLKPEKNDRFISTMQFKVKQYHFDQNPKV